MLLQYLPGQQEPYQSDDGKGYIDPNIDNHLPEDGCEFGVNDSRCLYLLLLCCQAAASAAKASQTSTPVMGRKPSDNGVRLLLFSVF